MYRIPTIIGWMLLIFVSLFLMFLGITQVLVVNNIVDSANPLYKMYNNVLNYQLINSTNITNQTRTTVGQNVIAGFTVTIAVSLIVLASFYLYRTFKKSAYISNPYVKYYIMLLLVVAIVLGPVGLILAGAFAVLSALLIDFANLDVESLNVYGTILTHSRDKREKRRFERKLTKEQDKAKKDQEKNSSSSQPTILVEDVQTSYVSEEQPLQSSEVVEDTNYVYAANTLSDESMLTDQQIDEIVDMNLESNLNEQDIQAEPLDSESNLTENEDIVVSGHTFYAAPKDENLSETNNQIQVNNLNEDVQNDVHEALNDPNVINDEFDIKEMIANDYDQEIYDESEDELTSQVEDDLIIHGKELNDQVQQEIVENVDEPLQTQEDVEDTNYAYDSYTLRNSTMLNNQQLDDVVDTNLESNIDEQEIQLENIEQPEVHLDDVLISDSSIEHFEQDPNHSVDLEQNELLKGYAYNQDSESENEVEEEKTFDLEESYTSETNVYEHNFAQEDITDTVTYEEQLDKPIDSETDELLNMSSNYETATSDDLVEEVDAIDLSSQYGIDEILETDAIEEVTDSVETNEFNNIETMQSDMHDSLTETEDLTSDEQISFEEEHEENTFGNMTEFEDSAIDDEQEINAKYFVDENEYLNDSDNLNNDQEDNEAYDPYLVTKDNIDSRTQERLSKEWIELSENIVKQKKQIQEMQESTPLYLLMKHIKQYNLLVGRANEIADLLNYDEDKLFAPLSLNYNEASAGVNEQDLSTDDTTNFEESDEINTEFKVPNLQAESFQSDLNNYENQDSIDSNVAHNTEINDNYDDEELITTFEDNDEIEEDQWEDNDDEDIILDINHQTNSQVSDILVDMQDHSFVEEDMKSPSASFEDDEIIEMSEYDFETETEYDSVNLNDNYQNDSVINTYDSVNNLVEENNSAHTAYTNDLSFDNFASSNANFANTEHKNVDDFNNDIKFANDWSDDFAYNSQGQAQPNIVFQANTNENNHVNNNINDNQSAYYNEYLERMKRLENIVIESSQKIVNNTVEINNDLYSINQRLDKLDHKASQLAETIEHMETGKLSFEKEYLYNPQMMIHAEDNYFAPGVPYYQAYSPVSTPYPSEKSRPYSYNPYINYNYHLNLHNVAKYTKQSVPYYTGCHICQKGLSHK